jgi:phosphoserine phosphatase
MKKVTICFDVDGTLITNKKPPYVANERVRTLLISLAHSKNVRIVVWSGGGQLHAEQAVAKLGLSEYVWKCMDKNHLGKIDGEHVFDPGFKPDIAFDDIQSCELGGINIIVREK